MPVPEARMDDGVLHTVLVRGVGRLEFARLFSAYSAGESRRLPPELIRVVTARPVRIRGEEEIVDVYTRQLTGLGHQDILFFGGRSSSRTRTLRRQGFCRALEEAGLEGRELPAPADVEQMRQWSYETARALFQSGRLPQAIFAYSDMTALKIMEAAEECGCLLYTALHECFQQTRLHSRGKRGNLHAMKMCIRDRARGLF